MVDEFYTDYDRLIRLACPDYDRCLNLIADNVPADAKALLDLGSGTGNLIISILNKHPYINVNGIELQQRLIKIAYEKLCGLGKPDVTITQADILNCEWPSAQVVTSSLTIHHFNYEQKKSIFTRILDNSNFFLYYDRFKGENKNQEENNLKQLFDYMRRKGLSEAMIQKAKQDIAANDHPLTIQQQNNLFDLVGFKYDLLYFKHGFAVYFCIKKE